MSASFPSQNIVFGSGKNSRFLIQELIMQHFHVFQKINLQNFCVTWNKIKQQLRPSHIISVNYLDLDQAHAAHKFQDQSKSLYQNNLIQNSREFKAENLVLERNYNRATIHHFPLRDYSESSLFYSALKNKLK